MSERASPPPREATPGPGDEVVEVPLLLPGWQVSALASAAQDRGVTVGEMVRSLLRGFIASWQRHAHA
jgi:hypothetical protein